MQEGADRMLGQAVNDSSEDQISFLDLEDGYSYSNSGVSEQSSNCSRERNARWCQNPLLYTIFHEIGQLELLDELFEHEFTDICLPIESETQLTRVFLDPALRPLFLAAQHRVCVQPDCTPEIQLEEIRTGHGHLMTDTDLPLQYRRSVGQGGSATVDEVLNLKDGRVYARKSWKRMDSVLDETGFHREIQALRRSKHIHCVQIVRPLLFLLLTETDSPISLHLSNVLLRAQFSSNPSIHARFGSYTTPSAMVFLMSPLADSDLCSFLKSASVTYDSQTILLLRRWFGCLASAVHSLHSIKIRHRDIKPQNILVQGHNILITDFNLAYDWSNSEDGETTVTWEGLTVRYAAPEIWRYEEANSSTDVWSLGCVFLEMATVIKGRSVRDYRDFFKEKRGNSHFFDNEVGIAEWCLLLEDSSTTDNTPLRWVGAMLERNGWKRMKSAALLEMMNEDAGDSGGYFGDCCQRTQLSTV
ncbi:uncharacterized protein L3040_006907 [Drepanopeziza brunnea f. sp. 'multigermtubi']|uniref:uncharacterized protein n=1 Tax=Drepanopeziza brunnea f. sp. 'multigermtubi' TaxID=698441 RepID=UPI00238F78E4|nr:hypothetical protein L3040_006907 [Drepanopeziza brunnea f. sp. 'multigermtubi']